MDESVPMYGHGRFRLMTCIELLAAVKLDGVPRYVVCDADLLKSLLGDGELHATKDISLVVELDPTCFIYYMNSCESEHDTNKNVRRQSIFRTTSPTQETAGQLLVDAEMGVAFTISRAVKKGEQLLHFFPTRNNLSSTEVGDVVGPVEVGPPSRRTPGRLR